MRQQCAPVSGPQGREPRPSISPQRRVVGYPLREQKPLDPVHMLDPLGDQAPPLPAKPAAVLLFRRGSNHHRTDPRLAALVGQKRPQQGLAIQPVRLGSPAPARCRDRGRIDHVALDAFLLQSAVQPEPVQSRLLDRDDRIALTRSRLRLALQLRDQLQEFRNIAGPHAVSGHLLALAGRQRGHQPCRTAQFQRHKNCAKLRADSGQSVGRMIEQHRRLQVGWISQPQSGRRSWSLSTPHGIFASSRKIALQFCRGLLAMTGTWACNLAPQVGARNHAEKASMLGCSG